MANQLGLDPIVDFKTKVFQRNLLFLRVDKIPPPVASDQTNWWSPSSYSEFLIDK